MKPVVVIGTGLGGLSAAIRMRAMGHPVLVLEANEQATSDATESARCLPPGEENVVEVREISEGGLGHQ